MSFMEWIRPIKDGRRMLFEELEEAYRPGCVRGQCARWAGCPAEWPIYLPLLDDSI